MGAIPYVLTHEQAGFTAMTSRRHRVATLVEAMLGLLDAHAPTLSPAHGLTVRLGGATIAFQDGAVHPFERLAAAIEARLAYERATAMCVAAGVTATPLWLVSGPDTLAKWLDWSKLAGKLAATLSLTDAAGAAPVAGRLIRRSRQDLGQMAARIRVFGGEAVAESVEFSHAVRAHGRFGRTSRITIARHRLPDTLLTALARDHGVNATRTASALVGHPFFQAHDFPAELHQTDDAVVIELGSASGPLAAIPPAARSAVPADADPAVPWRPTRGERASLYALARSGEALLASG